MPSASNSSSTSHGIDDDHQRRWYASVLMNRLMFIYFLQKKLFLDGGSENYLEDKLAASRGRGADKFYSVFLKALFFEGFARPEPARSAEARRGDLACWPVVAPNWVE